MAKPVNIPNSFATSTSAIPLSYLDQDFNALANSTNDLATYSNYVADTGAANAYIANFPTNINTSSLTAGLRVQFKASNANTGTSTLNVQVNSVSIGSGTIKLTDGSNLPANAIIAGALVDVMYDGTNFQLLSDSSGGAEVITNLTVTGNLSVTGSSTLSPDVVISGSSSNAALRITQTGAGNSLVVEDSINPDSTPFVVNTNGTVIVGSTTEQTLNNLTASLQVNGTGFNNSSISATRFNATAGSSPSFTFGRSRGATLGTNTTVVSGDTVGSLFFRAADGISYVDAASIVAQVDGTPGTNDMPGRLVFLTTADGASTVTERMRIDSSGNVGIGTTSPSTLLDVNGTARTKSYEMADAAGSYTSPTNGYRILASGSDIYLDWFNAGAQIFRTNGGAERMRITSAGNVGIGTTNPQVALEVLRTGNVAQITAANGTVVQRVGYCAFGVAFSGTETNHPYVLLINDTERMRIDTSGNVGIGTSSPAAKLDIVGIATKLSPSDQTANVYSFFVNNGGTTYIGRDNSAGTGFGGAAYASVLYSSGAYPLEFFTNGAERMRITSSGDILLTQTTSLIGTNTSDGADNKSVFVCGGGSGSDSRGAYVWARGNEFATSAGFLQLNAGNVASAAITMFTSGNERMRIDSAGNVGIGITSPASQLHIYPSSASIWTEGLRVNREGETGQYGIFNYSGGICNIVAVDSILSNPAMRFLTSVNGSTVTERMRIHSSGGVSIGNTTDSGAASLNVSGSMSGGYIAHANGTTAMAFGTDNVARVTPTATATFTSTVPAAGAICVLSILTSGATSYTITFGTGFKSTGTLATGTTTARYFNITFVSDGTNLIEMSRTVAIA